jgi:hypothetical protein
MTFGNRRVVALLAVLAAASSVHAAKRCSDTSGFDAAMQAVDAAVPCASATSHKKYVKNAKKLLGSQLSGACRKQFVQRFLAQSTCGRSGFVVCCSENRKGKDTSKAVKASKCRGSVCSESNPTNVGEGCTSGGACVTTTTTTTTTVPRTTVSTVPTTTTLPPPAAFLLDFGTYTAGGACGDVRDGSGTVLKTLTCGGLNIGGGGSTVQEGPTPDGSSNRFALAACNGSTCSVFPTSAMPPLNSSDPDCSDTGCNYGTPLPIPNQATPALTTCVLNTWKAPAGGSIDLAAGTASIDIPLTSATYLTSNVNQPCPRCSASGSPASPGTGTCDRGPRAGQPCVTTNSHGLTRDCLTGGSDATHPCTPGGVTECLDGAFIGPISVDLSPVTTGSSVSSNPDGLFCPNQTNAQAGCFGTSGPPIMKLCTRISETGTPAGPITPGTPAGTPGTPAGVTLASTFCIAATGSGLVDVSANLPGPGAVSLPGQFLLTEVVVTTTTNTTIATTSTTTSAPPTTTIATTTTTQGSTTTTTAPPNTLDFINGAAVGICGETRDAVTGGNKIRDLTCGNLYLGGGNGGVPPNMTPDGGTNRFTLSCTGSSCTLGATSTAPPQNSADVDCTNTGCNFGTPLPIPSGAPTCVLNTFSAPAGGTLDLTTGVASETIMLQSATYLSGNQTNPCPQCSATGSPGSPGKGTCNRGPRAGLDCTTTNSKGLTRDCPPGAPSEGFVGNLAVNLSPLTTGSSSKTDAAGNFCTGQGVRGAPGCFGPIGSNGGGAACRSITETGTAAVHPIVIGTPASVTLASVFCVPSSGNITIDIIGDLPGPGATTLPGTYVRH